ncbi:MAG: hypothetical protein A2Y79_14455 [Deltaproteobacteria bacterium RBG_13_43_22]|nr:MAG: hypothetical protein A2Y79_14455 [Deltaproteobacteria bacterium RBG_13_43_22]
MVFPKDSFFWARPSEFLSGRPSFRMEAFFLGRQSRPYDAGKTTSRVFSPLQVKGRNGYPVGWTRR